MTGPRRGRRGIRNLAYPFTLNGKPIEADVPGNRTLLNHLREDLNLTGAKGAGEIVTLPSAAAVVNAIRDATGVRIHRTPATPERVFHALCRMEAP